MKVRPSFGSSGQPLPGILHGTGEPIFEVLPQNVLANLRSPRSENARLWNLIYPLSQPTLNLRALMAIPPLWGTTPFETGDDELTPYYWGYSREGELLPGLRQAVLAVDGGWPGTEMDLVLVGKSNLIVVEAKVTSRPGHCARYLSSSCPEILRSDGYCRYWSKDGVRFDSLLDFESKPDENTTSEPACSRHYQLGRTLLLANWLSECTGLTPHLWLLTPEGHWRSLRRGWLDFANRVDDSGLWRRLRVLAWERVASLPRR